MTTEHVSTRGTVTSNRLAMVVALAVILASLAVVAAASGAAGVRPTGAQLPSRAQGATPETIATPGGPQELPCASTLGFERTLDACVAFVNTLPDAGAVTLAISGQTDAALSDIEFAEFADFVPVTVTEPRQLELLGGAAGDGPLATLDVSLEPGIAYVIVAWETYEQVEPILSAVPIDLAPVGADEARVAFFHGVTDAAALAVTGVPVPLDASILPGEATDADTIDAGSVDVEVVPGEVRDQVLFGDELQFEPGVSYLVLLAGTTGVGNTTFVYASAPTATGGD
jgi:hypothetical protein